VSRLRGYVKRSWALRKLIAPLLEVPPIGGLEDDVHRRPRPRRQPGNRMVETVHVVNLGDVVSANRTPRIGVAQRKDRACVLRDLVRTENGCLTIGSDRCAIRTVSRVGPAAVNAMSRNTLSPDTVTRGSVDGWPLLVERDAVQTEPTLGFRTPLSWSFVLMSIRAHPVRRISREPVRRPPTAIHLRS
jgi:hypothetical protein